LNSIVKEIVENRSQGVCELCLSRAARQKHHKKLKSQGGLDFPANIIHLCVKCHKRLHDTGWMKKELKFELKKELESIFLAEKWYTEQEIFELANVSKYDIEHAIKKQYVKVDLNRHDEVLIKGNSIVRWLT